jgi:hypothetical protein
MAKNKSAYLILAIIGIVLLLIVIIYIFFLSGVGGSGALQIYKTSATCEVTVINPLLSLGKLTIDKNSYCTSSKVIFCPPKLTSQSIFSTSGHLILSSSGIQDSISITVSGLPGYNSAKYQITLCGMPEGTTSGTLQTFVDNKIQDSLDVTFQAG